MCGVVVSSEDLLGQDCLRIELGEESSEQEASPWWRNSARRRLSVKLAIEPSRLEPGQSGLEFAAVAAAVQRGGCLQVQADHASIDCEGYPTLYVTSLQPVVAPLPSEGHFAPLKVPLLALSANYAQPSGLLDDEGRQLCQAFLHNNKCKYRKHCIFSHAVPESLQSLFLSKKRAEKKRAAIAARARDAGPVPELPASLAKHREEAVFTYDTARYPLGEAIARLLEVEGVAAALSQMHTLPELPVQVPNCPKVMHAFKFAGRKMPKPWTKALMREKRLIASMEKSEPWLAFMEVYNRFVRDVVVPLCGPVEETKGIRCQAPPTLRVHMPSRKPTIPPHTDSDYEAHQDAEINFWCPVTDVWGNNTLWTETAPGREDFHPIEIGYGQILRFHGNRCTHFTKSNDTGATRVSFDFRAIACCAYHDKFGGKIGDYNSQVYGA